MPRKASRVPACKAKNSPKNTPQKATITTVFVTPKPAISTQNPRPVPESVRRSVRVRAKGVESRLPEGYSTVEITAAESGSTFVKLAKQEQDVEVEDPVTESADIAASFVSVKEPVAANTDSDNLNAAVVNVKGKADTAVANGTTTQTTTSTSVDVTGVNSTSTSFTGSFISTYIAPSTAAPSFTSQVTDTNETQYADVGKPLEDNNTPEKTAVLGTPSTKKAVRFASSPLSSAPSSPSRLVPAIPTPAFPSDASGIYDTPTPAPSKVSAAALSNFYDEFEVEVSSLSSPVSLRTSEASYLISASAGGYEVEKVGNGSPSPPSPSASTPSESVTKTVLPAVSPTSDTEAAENELTAIYNSMTPCSPAHPPSDLSSSWSVPSCPVADVEGTEAEIALDALPSPAHPPAFSDLPSPETPSSAGGDFADGITTPSPVYSQFRNSEMQAAYDLSRLLSETGVTTLELDEHNGETESLEDPPEYDSLFGATYNLTSHNNRSEPSSPPFPEGDFTDATITPLEADNSTFLAASELSRLLSENDDTTMELTGEDESNDEDLEEPFNSESVEYVSLFDATYDLTSHIILSSNPSELELQPEAGAVGSQPPPRRPSPAARLLKCSTNTPSVPRVDYKFSWDVFGRIVENTSKNLLCYNEDGMHTGLKAAAASSRKLHNFKWFKAGGHWFKDALLESIHEIEKTANKAATEKIALRKVNEAREIKDGQTKELLDELFAKIEHKAADEPLESLSRLVDGESLDDVPDHLRVGLYNAQQHIIASESSAVYPYRVLPYQEIDYLFLYIAGLRHLLGGSPLLKSTLTSSPPTPSASPVKRARTDVDTDNHDYNIAEQMRPRKRVRVSAEGDVSAEESMDEDATFYLEGSGNKRPRALEDDDGRNPKRSKTQHTSAPVVSPFNRGTKRLRDTPGKAGPSAKIPRPNERPILTAKKRCTRGV